MATQRSIHQGDINDNSINPTWGTFDGKPDDSNNEERFLAIAENIFKIVNTKADANHNHDTRYFTQEQSDERYIPIGEMDTLYAKYGLVHYNNMLYINPDM